MPAHRTPSRSVEILPSPAPHAAPERADAVLVPGSGGRPAVRCSDAEREHVARILNLAAGEGLLTLAEADERLLQAYAARTRDDLVPLTADLPEQGRTLLENTPEARSAASAGLARHTVTVLVISLLLVAVWAAGAFLGDGPDFPWPIWPIGFMAFGVVNHRRRITRHLPR